MLSARQLVSRVAHEVDDIDFSPFNAQLHCAYAPSVVLLFPRTRSMGVNWAAGLIRWRPHVSADGRTHSLAHLHPFRFTCEVRIANGSARTITINVGFALHVFTSEFSNAAPETEEYRDDREYRTFDHERYNASLHLAALVRGIEKRKRFFAKNDNFFTVEMAHAPADHEYRVFFNVRRDKTNADSVTLIVQSAYFGRRQLSPKGARRKQVRFRVILLNALLGKPLREPPG